MIDIGVNLLSQQFDADREAVCARARQAGVRGMIVTASSIKESQAAAAYCAHSERQLVCTAGIHPHQATPPTAANLAQAMAELAVLAELPQVAAIGETGLDYFRDFAAPADQRAVCQAQLALAAQLGMPVFMHERDAADDVLALIEGSNIDPHTLVIHCFTGTEDALQRYLQRGCLIGITGWLCDRKRGAPLREIVAQIPLNQLLIETDAPYLRPHNAPKQALTGIASGTSSRRNEPALLPYVVATLADCLSLPADTVVEHSTANALRLFPRLGQALTERGSKVAEDHTDRSVRDRLATGQS